MLKLKNDHVNNEKLRRTSKGYLIFKGKFKFENGDIRIFYTKNKAGQFVIILGMPRNDQYPKSLLDKIELRYDSLM